MTAGQQTASAGSGARNGKLLLAVVVLYKMPAQTSPALLSLLSILRANPRAESAIDLIVCDNTPCEQVVPDPFPYPYHRFPHNPGLAQCYNLALREAVSRELPWLLVLDQDTTVSSEYVDEAIQVAQQSLQLPDVAMLAPKLLNQGVICSPHYPPWVGVPRPVDARMTGIAPTRLDVFNSGAVLRVASLQALGGFPEEYPLDYLDHATYTPLQLCGGKVFVLGSQLQHDLSTNEHGRHDPSLVRRQTGILDSQYRFFRQYGSPRERLLLRLRLLRAAAGRIVRLKNWDQTWRILKSAFRP